MGYITSGTSTTLTAKLTPQGRKMLLENDVNLIEYFSLGDSDANYNAVYALTPGLVPSDGGSIGPNSTVTNSVGQNVGIKSALLLNSTGTKMKAVEPISSAVTLETIAIGSTTVSGATLTTNLINRNNFNTDPLVNLFYSFSLPITANDDYKYTGLTSTYGGFANTALSGIDQTSIYVIAVPDIYMGEIMDGKTVKVVLPTTAGTYTLYSTFQQNGTPLNVQDGYYEDMAPNTQFLDNNIAFMFSDNIMKPNGGNASLSWATGYGTVKPFSMNGKQLYNFVSNSGLGYTADTICGIAYLEKGMVVITHPTIVNNIGGPMSGIAVTFDSISTQVTQNITCIANRGEFGLSSNATFTSTSVPRISEVGLYDIYGNLIALAKSDRQIERNVNDFLALGIKISL